MSDADKPTSRRAVGKRRKAREVALQFLYQLDLNGDADPIPHDEEFWARHPVDDDTRVFGDALVRGVKSNQERSITPFPNSRSTGTSIAWRSSTTTS
jgi:transcription termination factor NusB